MGPMIDDEVTPVFLINGFLEAGKTEFLSFTMDQDYFRTIPNTMTRCLQTPKPLLFMWTAWMRLLRTA